MNAQTVIYALDDIQRHEAREAARNVILQRYGTEPKREDFQRPLPPLPDRADYENRTIAEYPGWLVAIIGALMGVVFIAAAMPSFFRLFSVGRDYFLLHIAVDWQGAVVGFSTFLLAEFLIVLSTIAKQVLYRDRAGGNWFYVPIFMGLAMAFVGNWTVTQPQDAMGWLETVIPPAATLFTALVGERLILNSIRTRYRNERDFQEARKEIEAERRAQQHAEKAAYQEALHAWHNATKSPENAPDWKQTYANALKAKIQEVNGVGRGQKERTEYLATLDRGGWIMLIRRELDAENWFTERTAQATERLEAAPVNPTEAATMTPPPDAVAYSNGSH